MNRPPNEPSAPRHEVVIIGAGLAGASVAYHLRRLGMTDVLVLERATTPGSHSSGRNAAMVREGMDDAALQALGSESVAALRSGELAEFNPCGSMLLGAGEDDVRTRVPLAHGRGSFQAGDGVVDVGALLATYLRGVAVRTSTEVLRYTGTRDGVRLETSGGVLLAGTLVNAAGAWAGALGDVPLTPMNRHLFVTAPMPEVDPRWPWVWDLDADYYFRPESGGLLLSACDETPSTPGEPDVDDEVAALLAEKLRRHQPDLADVRVRRAWVGQRTFAEDRRPVIGYDPRTPGLFHMGGFGGFGVTISYAAGRYAADLLLGRIEADPRLGVARVLAAAEPVEG